MVGIVGTLGALLLLVGDMLLLGHFGAASDFRVGMLKTIPHPANTPVDRWIAWPDIGRHVSVWLLGDIRECACARRPRRACHVPAVVLSAVGLAAIHSVWAVFELAIQTCGGADSATGTCQALAASVQGYMRLSLLGLAVPGATASLILGVLVLRRRTHMPRWTVVANPLFLVVLLLPAFAAAPAPIGAVLVGGFASILLLVFFAVVHGSTRGK